MAIDDSLALAVLAGSASEYFAWRLTPQGRAARNPACILRLSDAMKGHYYDMKLVGSFNPAADDYELYQCVLHRQVDDGR